MPEVNTGPLESIVGPDGAEDLLIVTETNLLMINIAKLPADGDSDEVGQPWRSFIIKSEVITMLVRPRASPFLRPSAPTNEHSPWLLINLGSCLLLQDAASTLTTS